MSQPPCIFDLGGYCMFVGWEISTQPPHTIFIMTAIPFVHIAPAIEAIETITIWGTKAYAFGSEIFTISAILWCLNFMGNMIQKRLLSLVMLSVNSIASMHTLISKVSHSVLSHWQFSWDSWPMKAHSLYTPIAMKSLRILTTSVTRLDHILSMLDI